MLPSTKRMLILPTQNNIKYYKHSEKYEHSSILFPSKSIYSNLKRMNRGLRLLYSKNSRGDIMNYSFIRKNRSYLWRILKRVEERLNQLTEPIDLTCLYDTAFGELFPGIFWFLDEHNDIKFKMEHYYTKMLPIAIREKNEGTWR